MRGFVFGLMAAGVLVSGCAEMAAPPEDIMIPDNPPVAEAAPAAIPAAGATTAAEFDTTTAEDRAAAVAVEPASGGPLGTTTATLGSPADPGIWMKTGLVSAVTQGRVEYNGQTINIELRPSGNAGDGSQISLPAMRLLNAPLTGIITVVVYGS